MNFREQYSRKYFVDFFKDSLLPEDFTPGAEKVRLHFESDILKEATLLGQCDSLELKVYEVKHDSENDPRVTLSRETFRMMRHYNVKRALVLFTSDKSKNYRLSLATIDFKLDGSKVSKEYSNPRRYSFFLGPDSKIHTPEQYLVKKGRVKDNDFDDLLKRFSIEVVNKEFYDQIAMQFTKLVGGKRKLGSRIQEFEPLLKLPSATDHLKMQEFAVRLIGRLVFCWFLKKKTSQTNVPLIPEGILSSAAVKGCSTAEEGYYHSVLENLFFQVLNTPQEEREEQFNNKPYKQVPFLNGGLFEPHDDDFYEGRNRVNFALKIPNDWFLELFDTLETYNFTIDENTSVDVELAVDPEMLGRIFENLLAEINPETGETARKATGSYYTPRSIVEYMVDESLKQYLSTKTSITGEKLSDLLSYAKETTSLTAEEQAAILAALDEVKVIDPACGSGAFPMGMLQKIVLILQKVDPNSEQWIAKQLDKIDVLLRDDIVKRLRNKSVNYIRKLSILRDSIYGVDIQETAIEISKLRFFLSLIIDENIDDSIVNFGVEPLPNLEFKFICANTLVGLPSATNRGLYEDVAAINKLKKLREVYFRSSGKEKYDLEKKFITEQNKIFNKLLLWQQSDTQSFKLSTWEPFENNCSDWFDPEWMFGVTNGFDIVIGNPPYLESRNKLFNKNQKNVYQSEVQKRWGKASAQLIPAGADLLIYFYEKSLHLINKQGNIVLITQNSWLHSDYGQKFQHFLLAHTDVRAIIDSSYKYFDAKDGPNINTIISMFVGNMPSPANRMLLVRFTQDFSRLSYHYSQINELHASRQAEIKVYDYNDKRIRETKWGILFEANEVILNLLGQMRQKASSQSRIQIGQGLNLTKDYEIPHDFVVQNSLLSAAVSFMTAEDGAPFNLQATRTYLLNEDLLTSGQKNLLATHGYRCQSLKFKDRKQPDLILPRGIGRHFCAINTASAYSASYVEIYDIPTMDMRRNIWLFLNSSVAWIIRELSGRKNLGGGMLKAEATDLKSFPIYFDFRKPVEIQQISDSLLKREAQQPLSEINSAEHIAVDNIVFDFLGINTTEQKSLLSFLKDKITSREAKSKT